MERHSILIADDDEVLGEFLKRGLQEIGETVLTATKVVDTMAKLHNQQFDCIILDLYLTGGSSETVISHLRSNKQNLNYETPIIVMSGFLEPEVVKRILLQVQGLLVKPFEPAVLYSKVEAVLKVS